jgi:hypothetical protein
LRLVFFFKRSHPFIRILGLLGFTEAVGFIHLQLGNIGGVLGS